MISDQSKLTLKTKITLSDGTVHTFENIQSIHGTSYDDTFISSDAQRELFFENGGSDTFEGRVDIIGLELMRTGLITGRSRHSTKTKYT